MSQVVGFIGAGQLGEPMVLRLLLAGHRVIVHARRPEVRERLAAVGAEIVDSAAAVAADSAVVIVCTFSDEQLTAVAGGPDGVLANAKPGCVVISHTTGAVSTVARLAAETTSGAVLLDGPVSGSAQDIEAGMLTVLLGGPAEAVDAARPVLAAYARTVIATGGLGTALNVKLVNNALFAANAQLVAAAVDAAKHLGIEEQELLGALSACSGRSRAADSIRSTGGLAGFERSAAPFLRKDVAACTAVMSEVGIDLGLLGTAIEDGPLDLLRADAGRD